VKRIVRILLFLATPVLFGSPQQASAMQSASQKETIPAQTQAGNQASSHDRHNRRHTNSKRHRNHHKASVQH